MDIGRDEGNKTVQNGARERGLTTHECSRVDPAHHPIHTVHVHATHPVHPPSHPHVHHVHRVHPINPHATHITHPHTTHTIHAAHSHVHHVASSHPTASTAMVLRQQLCRAHRSSSLSLLVPTLRRLPLLLEPHDRRRVHRALSAALSLSLPRGV